ncbi:MAG: sigma-70 family RNA polymerase sigma factor [Planctomycetota bacterium]
MDDGEIESALTAAATEPGHDALGPVLEAYRARIERMIRVRMDPRIAGRAGASDVLQEAYVEVARRLPSYLDEWNAARTAPTEEREGPMPFFLWVRFIAAQSLQELHRRHLGAAVRDARREVDLAGRAGGALPEASSLLFASALVASGISPSGAAAVDEQRELLRKALDSLSAQDREVLFLRHFEQLSNKEIAELLGLSAPGASLRHLRALGRLQRALAELGVAFQPGE